jgi:F-type H+-transporting ATPase subunit b
MDVILHQLGGLFLGSVPTMLLFLLLVALYRVLVYGPLSAVLAERRSRTEGAIERAGLAIAAADAKAQEYEAKLRAVRTDVFAARRQRLEEWNRERESALADVRERARKSIAEAQAALSAEEAVARRSIESSAEDLAGEVLRAVLPPGLVLSGSSR